MIRHFDTLPDGREVLAVDLAGPQLRATVLTLGATVQDLRLDGVDHPLVLRLPTSRAYLEEGLYVGAIVGRFANRIGNARFELDGRTHEVDPNFLGRHLLHGGSDGIHAHLWQIADVQPAQVTMTLDLGDGHMGFPGALRITATLGVSGDALDVDLRAVAEAATPCNLAHHGYFDLDGAGDIRGHELWIAADHYVPVDADLIPTGEIAPVEGTPFDFRTMRPIGDAGYDHNLCLSPTRQEMRHVATLKGRNGLRMEIETTEPGLQVYDGAMFGRLVVADGQVRGPYAGVALETQGWPDAPNQPGFPDAILRPGQEYRALTAYRLVRP
ncbi:aldose epimerase family protein [Halodurantibacterium flavum]|uniref:Aldose 1-epimerase n=1 Tax=Halodurantibacterium flavum TaxID=1382802 RepID=A0ABW4S994_9RHOB